MPLAEGQKARKSKRISQISPPPPAKTIGGEGRISREICRFFPFGQSFGGRGSNLREKCRSLVAWPNIRRRGLPGSLIPFRTSFRNPVPALRGPHYPCRPDGAPNVWSTNEKIPSVGSFFSLERPTWSTIKADVPGSVPARDNIMKVWRGPFVLLSILVWICFSLHADESAKQTDPKHPGYEFRENHDPNGIGKASIPPILAVATSCSWTARSGPPAARLCRAQSNFPSESRGWPEAPAAASS